MKTSLQNLKVYKPNEIKTDLILDANENPQDITKAVFEEVLNQIQSIDFNRYPDTDSTELREAYACYAGVKAENVVCGNGSDEIIRLIHESYVDKGDCVLVHNPTFSMYDITNTITGGVTVKVESVDFVVNVDDIIEKAKEVNPKVIFICNPNNPTGYVFTKEDIVKVIDNTDAMVIVDEAYIEFGGQSVIDLINEKENLIVCRTMSKAFGLAGIRCGFGISNVKNIETLNKVKPPYNLNAVTQKIATIALNNNEVMKKSVKELIENRTALIEGLKEIPYLKAFSTGANFVFAKCDVASLREQIEYKASIRYFGSDYIRISVGTKEENQRLLEILKQVEV